NEQASDALTVKLGSAGGRARVLSLRGIPQGVTAQSGIYLPDAVFTAGLDRYVAELVRSHFALRMAVASAPTPLGSVAVASVPPLVASPNRPALLFPSTVPLAAPGRRVRVSGVIGMSGMNGEWTVASSETLNIGGFNVSVWHLAQKRGRAVVGSWLDGGTVVTFTDTLDNIIAGTPGYGTSRRTGSFSSRP